MANEVGMVGILCQMLSGNHPHRGCALYRAGLPCNGYPVGYAKVIAVYHVVVALFPRSAPCGEKA